MWSKIKSFFPAKCPNCDAKIKKSDNICSECGIKTPFSRATCVQCHFPIEKENSFCRNCGEHLIKTRVTEND